MEYVGKTRGEEVYFLNLAQIDKSISALDLKMWSKLRFSAYLVFNEGEPFIPEA